MPSSFQARASCPPQCDLTHFAPNHSFLLPRSAPCLALLLPRAQAPIIVNSLESSHSVLTPLPSHSTNQFPLLVNSIAALLSSFAALALVPGATSHSSHDKSLLKFPLAPSSFPLHSTPHTTISPYRYSCQAWCEDPGTQQCARAPQFLCSWSLQPWGEAGLHGDHTNKSKIASVGSVPKARYLVL